FIFIWAIENYALNTEKDPPKLLHSWRGHVDSITGIEYIDPTNVLISSALDGAIRIWNLKGHFMGTFGQTLPWNIYDPATYQHPNAPLDVLTDPRSLPRHSRLDRYSDESGDDSIEQKIKEVSVEKASVPVYKQVIDDVTI
ncbi:unnamed protein product, partial [Didymodactylos carnosus]